MPRTQAISGAALEYHDLVIAAGYEGIEELLCARQAITSKPVSQVEIILDGRAIEITENRVVDQDLGKVDAGCVGAAAPLGEHNATGGGAPEIAGLQADTVLEDLAAGAIDLDVDQVK